ncbi:uncharacterized protein BDW47DRAFT_111126 [Aspergillus candidus]|uniref:Uncharacterized protein n=1 Tax=Aspergillus candidus TaxID=41067 RepID=A0A2I2F355_ASPCN|nr:hypothetical protein BDW47DRAFT_111126 [Aspergillus candidus]PLB35064.1 hypothetical protein BDW47DRAFT_111126 [Aspergillus candidus]
MDLQGNPLPHGKRSTKVTNDPAASRNPIHEPAGPVQSDSLAAESATHGGGFSQNRGIHTSSSSTTQQSTHHTTKLPAAPVGGLREDRNRQEKYPEALGGQGDFPGVHGSGYVGGPTAAKQQQAAAASGSGSGYTHIGGQAPSYASDVTGLPGQGKPKGKNLHEGGFDDDPRHNASFNSEIGNQNDPSRAAEQTFQSRAAEGGVEVGGARQKNVDSHHGGFEALERDQRA